MVRALKAKCGEEESTTPSHGIGKCQGSKRKIFKRVMPAGHVRDFDY